MWATYFPKGSETRHSLLSLRQDFAKYGHRLGNLDIFGRGWPGFMSTPEHSMAGLKSSITKPLARREIALERAQGQE